MKKIILLFIMMLAVAGVQAKTYKLYSKFKTVANNGNASWDAANNKLTVSKSSANTVQMFAFPAGTLSKYKRIILPAIGDNYAKYRVLFLANGTTKFTWTFGSATAKNSTIDSFVTTGSNGLKMAESDIVLIDEIRIGGTNMSDSDPAIELTINPSEVYLESAEYEGNTTNFSNLTTGGTWPGTSLISLPAAVSSGLQIVGKDSGTDNYADIRDYHAIIFRISDFTTQGGGKMRAFVCKSDAESTLVTRFANPISNTKDVNWATEVGPTADGYYYIDVSDCSRLIGIKTNNYQTASSWKIAEVYLVKSSLTITDGLDMADMVYDRIGATVDYDRTFTVGQKSTVCLPFALTADEVAAAGTFYELTGAADGKLTFTAVETTKAYKPYMFKAKTATPFASLTGKTIVASEGAATSYAVGGYTFQGTLAHQTVASGVYGWNATNGEFSKTNTADVTIDAFRAYITGGARARLSAVFDDEPTAIQTVKAASAVESGATYNLQGQRVSEGHKGLVIKNGRKYIIR